MAATRRLHKVQRVSRRLAGSRSAQRSLLRWTTIVWRQSRHFCSKTHSSCSACKLTWRVLPILTVLPMCPTMHIVSTASSSYRARPLQKSVASVTSSFLQDKMQCSKPARAPPILNSAGEGGCVTEVDRVTDAPRPLALAPTASASYRHRSLQKSVTSVTLVTRRVSQKMWLQQEIKKYPKVSQKTEVVMEPMKKRVVVLARGIDNRVVVFELRAMQLPVALAQLHHVIEARARTIRTAQAWTVVTHVNAERNNEYVARIAVLRRNGVARLDNVYLAWRRIVEATFANAVTPIRRSWARMPARTGRPQPASGLMRVCPMRSTTPTRVIASCSSLEMPQERVACC